MDIPDLQSQTDHRRVKIDKVGVQGIRYPIVVEDRARKIQHTIAEISIFVELQHSRRGTHISRCVEILHRYHTESVIAKLELLLAELADLLKAEAAYMEIDFPYFLEVRSPVSQKPALLDYHCYFRAQHKQGFALSIGAIVPVTTLCPCSREISARGAHNQRAYVDICLSYREFIWLEELIELAENAASSPIYPLLKRNDEKYVTEAAYAKPRFVEDVVREITLQLNADQRVLEFDVQVSSQESIHNYNAYARVHRVKQ